jgi:hypothetical protein
MFISEKQKAFFFKYLNASLILLNTQRQIKTYTFWWKYWITY